MIATVAIAIATVFYPWLRDRLLKSPDRPEVAISLYLESRRPFVDLFVTEGHLCIHNVGTRAARNIQFEKGFSFTPREGVMFHDVDFLEKVIGVLVPQQSISRFICTHMGVRERLNDVMCGDNNSVVEVIVKYQDFNGKCYKDSFTLDFRGLIDT